MNSIDYFNNKAEIYSKYRPSYSNDAIHFLYNEKIVNSQDIIADIGSGTGILAKPFLQQGNNLFAVEPNKEMLSIAARELKEFTNFYAISGTAEYTTLPSNSVDLIIVGQAFHWFDKTKFKSECYRILRQDGYILLLWNRKIQTSTMELERQEIRKKYTSILDMYKNDWSLRENAVKEFYKEFNYKTFAHPITNSYEEFIGRAFSDSRAPKENTILAKQYKNDLDKYFIKYATNMKLIVPNETILYWGKI